MSTGIQWTDETWNPVVGCTKVGQGCKNCYAKDLHDKRHKALLAGKAMPKQYRAPFETIQLMPERLTAPLRWRARKRVFVNSVSDLFHEDVPDEYLDRVFAVMAAAPQHTFQLLTKRPERMRRYVSAWVSNSQHPGAPNELDARWDAARRWLLRQLKSPSDYRSMGLRERVGVMMAFQAWPLPNVWLGVSVEDQEAADARIPELLATPAAVRFLSCEPLLGFVDLRESDPQSSALDAYEDDPKIDWVIVGGESGPGARPCDVAWVRSVVSQCRAAGVAVFCKQLGANVRSTNDAGFDGDTPTSWPAGTQHNVAAGYQGAPLRVYLKSREGADPAEWPEDLRVREFPR